MVEGDLDVDGQMVLRPESPSNSSNSKLEMDKSSGSENEYNPDKMNITPTRAWKDLSLYLATQVLV